MATLMSRSRRSVSLSSSRRSFAVGITSNGHIVRTIGRLAVHEAEALAGGINAVCRPQFVAAVKGGAR